MVFSRILLAVLNSGVLTRWRLTCIIYDTVLITESSCHFLGSRCIPDGRRVSQLWTRVLLFSLCRGTSRRFFFFFLVLRVTFPGLSVHCLLFLFLRVGSLEQARLVTRNKSNSFLYEKSLFFLLSRETCHLVSISMLDISSNALHLWFNAIRLIILAYLPSIL